MADSSYYQGDYIRHPVLYELSHKYGLQSDSDPDAALPCKLDELKEHIRREIRKELKIKEGAEKLREVAKDRKSLADVATIVKKANFKLAELQAELQELESQIILTQGQTSPNTPPLALNNGQDAVLSPVSGHTTPTQGDALFSDMRLVSLEKQLNIELKVKQGAENMIQSLTSGHSRDKKLLQEAQQMLADSRAKIEFLKLRILKIKQNKQLRQQQGASSGDTPSNGDSHQAKEKYEPNLEPPLEDRVEELRHRLRIEAAVVEGAKNVIRLLQSSRVADKKALQEPSSGKRLSRSPAQRLSRSPARFRGQSPLAGRKSKGSQCASTQAGEPFEARSQRKPRTVHIDVYCTGSEDADASGSTDDTEEMSDSWSSPQTVFESEKLRVVHSKVGKERLPVGFLRRQQQQQRQEKVANIISRRSESFKYEAAKTPEQQKQQQETMRGYDSDDGLSSHYPSQVSSYSTLRAATESSLPQSEVATTASRDSSWSTISTSSMAIGGEYDSEAATSWKDTATDLESLVQSTLSLAQSDSFEYADSADRLRIREKERAWAGEEKKDDGSKTWKSPNTERKHFLQQQKMKEFLEKHLGTSSLPLWKPPTTEDSDDDETGDAWSFCGRDSAGSPRQSSTTLKREDTVKRMTPAKDKNENHGSSPKGSAKTTSLLKPPPRETGSLSDSGPHRYMRRTAIGPFGSKSPSPPPSKLASSITSPFTTIPGKRTDQLSKAEKFGRIVGALRKPGHHVGPSKNPECACEHCRKYYEETGHRTRTRSVGDVPVDDVSGNWKENLNALKAKIVPTSGTNDGTAGLESDLESSITEDASTDEKLIRQHISSVIGSEDDDNDE